MTRTRVLQIIPNLGSTGGAEWLVYHLASSLDRKRYDVSVLAFFAPRGSGIEQALAHDQIGTEFLDKRVGFDPTMFWKIHRAIARLRPDIVHTHLAVLQYALPSLLSRRCTPVVHTVHNVAERELDQRAGRWAHHLSFRAGVAPVVIADAVDRSFRSMYRTAPAALIPNGIPVARYASPRMGRAEWRRSVGIEQGVFLFTCVGRLSEQKGARDLLRAFAATVERPGRRSELALLGEGELRRELERTANALGIGRRVHFLGVRNDVPEALGASDAFALASHWEGHPLSVMEAMASGLPVIATAVGGTPEIVSARVTGELVSAGDVEALASAMYRILSDDELRGRMSRAAREHALRHFDISAMARRYEDLYERLLAAARPGLR